jgi:hypothetical protein
MTLEDERDDEQEPEIVIHPDQLPLLGEPEEGEEGEP